MPAKWQTWMPFHIDRFRGSPDVQAMHPAARAGYLYLLATAWQTDDCSLSADPLDLATAAGFTDEMWTLHGPRILRKFVVLENGRLQNAALLAEWNEAKRIFESRAEAARRTNESRSADSDKTVTANKKRGHRHTVTETDTGTKTGTLFEDSSNPLAPSGDSEPIAGAIPLNDGTEFKVSRKFVDELQMLYPAVDVMQEFRNMKGWCLGNQRNLKTRSGVKAFITNWLKKSQDSAPRVNGGRNGYHGNGTKSAAVRGGAMASLAKLDAKSDVGDLGSAGRVVQAR